jgi:hypothetical protein
MRARVAVLEDALCSQAIRGIGFHTWMLFLQFLLSPAAVFSTPVHIPRKSGQNRPEHKWNAHFLSSVLLESNVEMVESKNEPSPQTSALKGATPKIVINAA